MTESVDAWCDKDDELVTSLQRYLQAREAMFTRSRTISISEMATTLAHEINTPIATLTNLIEGLKYRLSELPSVSSEIIAALESAEEQAVFTSDVIKRIRDYTQTRTPVRAVLMANDVILEAVSLLDWYFVVHGCRIDVVKGDQKILGDRTMLQQVILNVLKNAADAMLETDVTHRLIKVTCESTAQRLRIVIRDHGPGLNEAKETLFTPFVTSKPEGMGVGLNICRSFLDLHGGRLWLADADGGGCRTIIELPLHEFKAS